MGHGYLRVQDNLQSSFTVAPLGNFTKIITVLIHTLVEQRAGSHGTTTA